MNAASPSLRWDHEGRLFLGALSRPIASVHPFGGAGSEHLPEYVGLITLAGVERPRGGSKVAVQQAMEDAVRSWLTAALS